jgi:hypothetical protein
MEYGPGSVVINGVGYFVGERRGYHISTMVQPGYKVSARSKMALDRWAWRNPKSAVVWHHYPAYSWWESAEMAERKDRLMKRVAKRTRGLRTTMRALAASFGVSYGSMHRTVGLLEKAGVVLVKRTRGRLGRTVIQMIQPQNREAVPTTSTHSSSRSMGGSFPRQAPGVPLEAPDEDRYKRGEGDWWDRLRERARLYREEINREVPW